MAIKFPLIQFRGKTTGRSCKVTQDCHVVQSGEAWIQDVFVESTDETEINVYFSGSFRKVTADTTANSAMRLGLEGNIDLLKLFGQKIEVNMKQCAIEKLQIQGSEINISGDGNIVEAEVAGSNIQLNITITALSVGEQSLNIELNGEQIKPGFVVTPTPNPTKIPTPTPTPTPTQATNTPTPTQATNTPTPTQDSTYYNMIKDIIDYTEENGVYRDENGWIDFEKKTDNFDEGYILCVEKLIDAYQFAEDEKIDLYIYNERTHNDDLMKDVALSKEGLKTALAYNMVLDSVIIDIRRSEEYCSDPVLQDMVKSIVHKEEWASS